MNAASPSLLHLPVPARRFVDALYQRRFFVIGFPLGVAVIAATLIWFATPWYSAETTLLPPSESSDPFANLTGMIENSALNRIGLFTTSTASDIYVEILNSRRLRESLIRRFDLQKRYDIKTMDGTLKELDLHVTVKSGNSGVVGVKVEDTSKQGAADMANFLIFELDRFNRETLQTRGKRTRQFLEARLADMERRMSAAENKLTTYERAHKVVVGGDESSVRGMADVMAQKMGLQVRRAYVASYSAPGSPAVREIDAEIDAFERELSRLPELKNEGARLALDATVQRKLFTFLTAQLEEARVQEMRDTPTITVLDEARAPETKTRPKRTLFVLSSTLVAVLLACAWVWFASRRERFGVPSSA
jgi:tyrosine-protein kinase Etk/Wzc